MATKSVPSKNGLSPALAVPYSQEAEEATIGALIMDSEKFDDIAVWLKPEDFYILRLNYIWAAMLSVRAQRQALDYLTIIEALKAAGRLEDVGGASYLTHLMNAMPTSAHAEVYARLVQRAAVRRRLMAAGDEFKQLALDEEMPLEQVLSEAEKRFTVVKDTSLDDDEEPWRETVLRIMDEVSDRMDNPDKIMGVPSGFREVDDLLCGWQKTDFIVIAGRPGSGKTSLMLSYAYNAMKLGLRVGFASQEMNRDQLCYRLASMDAGVNLQALRLGRLDQNQYRRFLTSMDRMARMPLLVTDANRLTPVRLKAKILRWMRRTGVDVVFVDYLQILSSGGMYRGSERTQEVSYFARELKQIARETRLPIIAAAQLNRGVEERQDKRPVLSDLKESGAIEEEADIVQFLYRDVMYNEATEFPNRADIIVAKHRNGPTGVVSLHFDNRLTKFSDQRVQSVDLSGL